MVLHWRPSSRRFRRRSLAVLAPVVACALTFGCLREKAPAAVDAAPASAPSLAAIGVETGAWPKTMVVAEPETSVAIEADASLALSGELEDASDDAADAFDARDAKPDVNNDDAALLGTKTYPDETPMRGIRKITSAAAKVHKAPKDQNIIATLPRGTEVSLVASLYEDWLRVRYTDPNTGVRRQGWIYITTFAGPRTKTCPTGWTWHPQDGGWCDRECTKNTDCKALKGYKCSGTSCFFAAVE